MVTPAVENPFCTPIRRAAFVMLLLGFLAVARAENATSEAFERAAAHGTLVQEGLARCERYLQAWLGAAEPTSGLIPRNLHDSPYWNGKDTAADNYPFMVLTAALTNRPLLESRLRPMLEAERRLTARDGWLRLTDDYNLKGQPSLRFPTPDPARIIFNSAEYVKDGLLPLTEWMGASPWSERMLELIDDIFALAQADTPFGQIPLPGADRAVGVEVNGDLLQALARVYWMTGRDEKYLRWGVRLADHYLLPAAGNHPTRDFATLRLRDHGCEIVSGLCEFYATLHFAGQLPGGEEWADRRESYRPHLHEMLDRILEVGRNADGLLYNEVNPRTGQVINAGLSDSWGYVLDGFYTVYLVDGITAYREAAVQPLTALASKYRNYNWEPRADTATFPLGSMDGYADTIEGALNLYNRLVSEPRVASLPDWIDSETRKLWAFQRENGFIESWHGDGNFARTTIMYCLWKTQGVTAHPWRADLRLGAVREGDKLLLVVTADEPWQGTLVFDQPRHAQKLRLPLDWPRINQFPEWFTVQAAERYSITIGAAAARMHVGSELAKGYNVTLPARGRLNLTITAGR